MHSVLTAAALEERVVDAMGSLIEFKDDEFFVFVKEESLAEEPPIAPQEDDAVAEEEGPAEEPPTAPQRDDTSAEDVAPEQEGEATVEAVPDEDSVLEEQAHAEAAVEELEEEEEEWYEEDACDDTWETEAASDESVAAPTATGQKPKAKPKPKPKVGKPAFEQKKAPEEPEATRRLSPREPYRDNLAEKRLKEYSMYGPSDILNMPSDPLLRFKPQKSGTSFHQPKLEPLGSGVDRANIYSKRVCKLAYHRATSPPPIYREYFDKVTNVVDEDRKPWQNDLDHFHPELMEKRAIRQRDAYNKTPAPLPQKTRVTKSLRESNSSPALTQRTQAKVLPPPSPSRSSPSTPPSPARSHLSKTASRSASTPTLPPAGGHTLEDVTAVYRLPPMAAGRPAGRRAGHSATRTVKRPLVQGGIEMLARLHNGELPQILCRPT
jgi:hypothetical protein